GTDILITYGPILPMAIDTFMLEIVGAETQGNTSPVVGPSPQHMGPEPIELGPVLEGIGLPFDFPAPIGGIKIAKGPTGPCPPSWGFIGPAELGRLLGIPRIEKWTGLHHGHLKARLGKHFGGHAPTGPRAYDDGIIDSCAFFDLHNMSLGFM